MATSTDQLASEDVEVKIDIEALEKELNESEFSKGWEKGREDTIMMMKKSFFPTSDQVLKSAEITFREMEKQFGKVFNHVFAGFNLKYDEPAILFCLKPGAENLRAKACYFGVLLSNAIYEAGLLPLNVLVTKTGTTDIQLVSHDFKFQRNLNA